MPTLRFRSDTQSAKAGLADLRRDLRQTAETTDELNESAQAAGEAMPIEESVRFRAELELLADRIAGVVEENKAANIEAQAWADTMAEVRENIIGAVKYAGQLALNLGEFAVKGVVATAAAQEINASWNATSLAAKTLIGRVTGLAIEIGALTLAWKGYQAILDNTGRSLEDHRSNLEREREANAKFAAEVSQPWKEMYAGVKAVAGELVNFDEILKEVDRSATVGTRNYVENLNNLGQLLRDIADTGSAVLQAPLVGGNPEDIRRNNDLLREQGEITNRLAQFNAERSDDRALRNQIRDRIEQETKLRKEMAEITAQTERKQADATIQRYRDEMNALVEANQFAVTATDEKTGKQVIIETAAGERVRKLLEESIKHREKVELDWQKRLEDERKRLDDHTRTMNEKAEADYIAMRNKEYQESIKLARAEFDERMKLIAEQQRFNYQAMQHEIQQRKEAEEKKLDEEKKAAEKRRAFILQQFGGEQAAAQMVQNAVDPRQVRQNFVRNAGQQAAADFRKKNIDDFDITDTASMNRFEAQQKAAQRQAEAQAFRQFNAGKADPQKLATAQQQAAQQTLQTMQANGDLSGNVVATLTQVTNGAIQQQQNIDTLNRQVQQLQGQAKGLYNASSMSAQRQKAQNGGLTN